MSADHPEVTIITPARDSGAFINKCIGSVVMQNFTDWELLIINDGSSDNTCDIAGSYSSKDPRIFLYDSPGSGVSAARNHGLEMARGRYITFLDSDDMLEPDYLSELVSNAVNENADITQCSFCYLYRDGKTVKDTESASGIYTDHKEIMDAYFSGIIGKITVACWGKLFRRELIDNMRFDEEITIQEDAFFSFLCCMKASKIVCIDTPLYCYLQHPGSTRGRAFDDSKMHYFTIFDRELDMCKDDPSITLRILTRKLITSFDLMSKIIEDDSGKESLGELRGIALETSDAIRKLGRPDMKTGMKVFLIRHFPSAYYGLLRIKYGRGRYE